MQDWRTSNHLLYRSDVKAHDACEPIRLLAIVLVERNRCKCNPSCSKTSQVVGRRIFSPAYSGATRPEATYEKSVEKS